MATVTEATVAPVARRFAVSLGALPAASLVAAIASSFTAYKAQLLLADSYMGLYSGRFIANHGIPSQEPFTALANGRWIDQQWLAHLIDYGAWSVGGYRAMALLSVGMATAAFALLAVVLRRRGVSTIPIALCVAPAVVLASFSFFVRAQAFAYLPFAVLILLCLEDERHGRLRWRMALLVPLLAAWANLHGSVLLGAALAVAYLAWRASRRFRVARREALAYGGLAALCALAPLATPYGFATIGYYKSLLGNSAIHANVSEWRPAAFPLSLALFALIALVVAGVVLAIRDGRRPCAAVLAGTFLLAAPAVMAVRNEAWFAMAAAVLLGDTFGRRYSPWRRMAPVSVALLTVSAVAFAWVTVAPLVTQGQATFGLGPPHRAISAAGSYVAAHPCARVLADDPAASAALWHEPALSGNLAYDGRLEQYPEPVLARWFDFQNARPGRWARAVAGYDVLVATRPLHPRLVRRLAADRHYRVIAHDWLGIAVARRGAPRACVNRPA